MEELEENKDKKGKKPKVNRPELMGGFLNVSEYCEQSRVWQHKFVEDMALFQSKDPSLDAAFASDWLVAIETLEAFESDEVMVDYLGEKTDFVNRQRKVVLGLANELEFYVRKAFPDDERILFEFGFADLTYVANGARFVVNAYTMYSIMEDYLVQLQAAGMPLTFEAQLDTELSKLAEGEINQERQKRLRIRATTQRARLYNALYTYWKRVSDVARVLYYGQDVAAAHFWQRGK